VGSSLAIFADPVEEVHSLFDGMYNVDTINGFLITQGDLGSEDVLREAIRLLVRDETWRVRQQHGRMSRATLIFVTISLVGLTDTEADLPARRFRAG